MTKSAEKQKPEKTPSKTGKDSDNKGANKPKGK